MAEIKKTVLTGVEMEYFSFGNGAKTMVILPGLSIKSVMLSAEIIERDYKAFTEDYTVYVFDRNLLVSPDYSIDMMAADTAKVMKALGLSDCYIFGASQGGMMAMVMAYEFPELVKKAVLSATSARPSGKSLEKLGNWAELAGKHDTDGLVQSFLDSLYSKNFTAKYGDVIRASLADISDEEFDRFVIMANAAADPGMYDKLDNIKCPVLVIGSRGDKVLGVDASYEIAEKLGCEKYIYGSEYGHCVFDEAPDHKMRIKDFFDKEQ